MTSATAETLHPQAQEGPTAPLHRLINKSRRVSSALKTVSGYPEES
jgi:hypothetical protein